MGPKVDGKTLCTESVAMGMSHSEVQVETQAKGVTLPTRAAPSRGCERAREAPE
jgi:hypothetical protein